MIFINIFTIDSIFGDVSWTYKCLEPILPRPETAFFLKDRDGNLEFKLMRKDDLEDYYEIMMHPGFTDGNHGDSGSPILRKVDVLDKHYKEKIGAAEKRNVIVGINVKGRGIDSFIGDYRKCSTIGIKVSEDIIHWLKNLDSKYGDAGEKLFCFALRRS